MTATPELDVPLIDLIEARTRRLMAEHHAIANWGNGRRERRQLVETIDASLDEWNRLHRCEART